MNDYIIKNITEKNSKTYLIRVLNELENKDDDLYREIEDDIYHELYGCHFTDFTLEKAFEKMVNEDGTKGGHWTIEQTTSVANQYRIDVDKYDWCYVMNMIYSDYYGCVSDDVSTYANLAKRFIFDKDAPEGKAYLYFKAMCYSK